MRFSKAAKAALALAFSDELKDRLQRFSRNELTEDPSVADEQLRVSLGKLRSSFVEAEAIIGEIFPADDEGGG